MGFLAPVKLYMVLPCMVAQYIEKPSYVISTQDGSVYSFYSATNMIVDLAGTRIVFGPNFSVI